MVSMMYFVNFFIFVELLGKQKLGVEFVFPQDEEQEEPSPKSMKRK